MRVNSSLVSRNSNHMASLTVAVNIYVANSSIFADNMCKVSKCYLERQRGLVIESQ